MPMSARQILHQIQKISNTQDGQKIALYLENDGEISPKYIHNFLECCLPIFPD
jgi:hypothetical protein